MRKIEELLKLEMTKADIKIADVEETEGLIRGIKIIGIERLKRFGTYDKTKPITVRTLNDKYRIIDGQHRFQYAKDVLNSEEIPANIIKDALTDEEEIALATKLNESTSCYVRNSFIDDYILITKLKKDNTLEEIGNILGRKKWGQNKLKKYSALDDINPEVFDLIKNYENHKLDLGEDDSIKVPKWHFNESLLRELKEINTTMKIHEEDKPAIQKKLVEGLIKGEIENRKQFIDIIEKMTTVESSGELSDQEEQEFKDIKDITKVISNLKKNFNDGHNKDVSKNFRNFLRLTKETFIIYIQSLLKEKEFKSAKNYIEILKSLYKAQDKDVINLEKEYEEAVKPIKADKVVETEKVVIKRKKKNSTPIADYTTDEYIPKGLMKKIADILPDMNSKVITKENFVSIVILSGKKGNSIIGLAGEAGESTIRNCRKKCIDNKEVLEQLENLEKDDNLSISDTVKLGYFIMYLTTKRKYQK